MRKHLRGHFAKQPMSPLSVAAKRHLNSYWVRHVMQFIKSASLAVRMDSPEKRNTGERRAARACRTESRKAGGAPRLRSGGAGSNSRRAVCKRKVAGREAQINPGLTQWRSSHERCTVLCQARHPTRSLPPLRSLLLDCRNRNTGKGFRRRVIHRSLNFLLSTLLSSASDRTEDGETHDGVIANLVFWIPKENRQYSKAVKLLGTN